MSIVFLFMTAFWYEVSFDKSFVQVFYSKDVFYLLLYNWILENKIDILIFSVISFLDPLVLYHYLPTRLYRNGYFLCSSFREQYL